MTTPTITPYARVNLAVSILDHARGQPADRQAVAIDRALLALRGATVDEIQQLTTEATG